MNLTDRDLAVVDQAIREDHALSGKLAIRLVGEVRRLRTDVRLLTEELTAARHPYRAGTDVIVGYCDVGRGTPDVCLARADDPVHRTVAVILGIPE